MRRVLFVCLGNICRSPMARMVLCQLARDAGMERELFVDSAGTSDEERGNPLYPPARRTLLKHGVELLPHRARRIRREDYAAFDLLVGMEESNVSAMRRFFGGDPENKICLLLGFAGEERGIDDPWYSGDFERAYSDIERGCKALLQTIEREG